MSARVIAGIAKGRKLKLVPGEGTRPIMDRVKEALFSILTPILSDATFLDLFAGTGGVGIEALSRGAERAVFVDNSRLAITTIQENLQTCGFDDPEFSEVIRADVLVYLQAEPPETFEVVYIAPPQYKQIWRTALETLDANPDHLDSDAVVVVQIDPKEYITFPLQNLELTDQRTYGNTMLLFYTKLEEESVT